MRKALVITVLLIALPLAAASAAQSREAASRKSSPVCMENAVTQTDMNLCAMADAQEADRRLNKTYQAVLCHLNGQERAQLVASERAWIAFKDADCAFWGGGGGSIAPMNTSQCLADLSRQRAEELDHWPPNVEHDGIAPCN